MAEDNLQFPELPLEKYLSNRELLEEIINQLSKDLGSDGAEIRSLIDNDSTFDHDKFVAMLSKKLEYLDNKNRLESVLYLIDLPEKTGGKPIRWNNYDELAILVLDREFQKVWFRKWHKKFRS